MSRRVAAPLFACIIAITLAAQEPNTPTAPRKGTFTGDLKLTPMSDGVHMKVRDPFAYNDGLGHDLAVAPGFLTDGASIPRVLWSIVGSPFSGGNYVKAAVIHDEGCVSHKYTWQVTHRMFYTAMLDSGMTEHYAKLLYFGVRVGGPKWKFVNQSNQEVETRTPQTKVIELKPQPVSEQKVKSFDAILTSREQQGHPVTVEEIDRMTEPTENISISVGQTSQSATGNGNMQVEIGAGATVRAEECSAVGIGNNVNCGNNLNVKSVRYYCNGQRVTQAPGESSVYDFTSDEGYFAEWGIMQNMGYSQRWSDLLNECTEQLKRNKEWISPLLLCADANFHLGNRAEAQKQLSEFQQKRGDAYKDAPCPGWENTIRRELNEPANGVPNN
jgi:Protein of unknown function (DUF1353)